MPLHRISELDNGFILGLWRITEPPEDLVQIARLSSEELNFYQRLNNHQRKLHWLAWRALLKDMVNKPYLEIDYTANGKPFVRNVSLQISVSHSGPWAACITHPSQPTGVDLEAIRPRILKVKERFLSGKELQWHNSYLNNLRHLILLWCIKEAIYKFAGINGLDFRNQISIPPFVSLTQGQILCELQLTHYHSTKILIKYEDIDSEHVMAYVAEQESV
jgi:phosphopantetheinyl transferase